MTLDKVFSRYTREPFKLRPWEIARMTDWQLERLYRKPEEDAAREAKGLPPLDEVGEMPSPMPKEREAFVAWWASVNGGDREEALRMYALENPDNGEHAA